MSQVVLSTSLSKHTIVARAHLTITLLHQISDAFTPARDLESPFQQILVRTFGDHQFRKCCFDMSDVVYTITFSASDTARTLNYQGKPARIAPSDEAAFIIWAEQVDFVKPDEYNVEGHPYFIAT